LLHFYFRVQVVNSVTQLKLMEVYLSPNGSASYEQFFAKGMIASEYSVNAFPRKILCSIEVITTFGRASIHRYDGQCTLPINDAYEKIYFLVWVWLVIVWFRQCGIFWNCSDSVVYFVFQFNTLHLTLNNKSINQ
jgi:hypothetical protein